MRTRAKPGSNKSLKDVPKSWGKESSCRYIVRVNQIIRAKVRLPLRKFQSAPPHTIRLTHTQTNKHEITSKNRKERESGTAVFFGQKTMAPGDQGLQLKLQIENKNLRPPAPPADDYRWGANSLQVVMGIHPMHFQRKLKQKKKATKICERVWFTAKRTSHWSGMRVSKRHNTDTGSASFFAP